MTNREQLTQQINDSFQNVRLDDGIGLWEAQGLDDRLTSQECRKLRVKDEKENWKNIPLIDLYRCSSSLSFFDAKGIRFHLPILLLFAIGFFEKEQKDLFEKGLTEGCSEPDIEFHLIDMISHQKNKDDIDEFNKKYYTELCCLLNTEQLKCIKHFLEFKRCELEEYYTNTYAKEFGTSPTAVKNDKDYIKLEIGIKFWENKITTANKV